MQVIRFSPGNVSYIIHITQSRKIYLPCMADLDHEVGIGDLSDVLMVRSSTCQDTLELAREFCLKNSEQKIRKTKNIYIRLTSGLPSIPANSNQSWNWGDPAGPNFSDLHGLEPTPITGACRR